MEELLENVIRKVIFKKYPFLYYVEVEDTFSDLPNLSGLLGTLYTCRLKSEKCLSSEEQMEIDTEVKTIFKMLYSSNRMDFNTPNVACYFNCEGEDGYTFSSKMGYNHH